MKWLVGVDLARGSRGAVRLAAFLREVVGDEVTGLHTVDLPAVANQRWTESMRAEVHRLLTEFIAEEGATGMPFGVIESNDVEKTLMEACELNAVDGLVIGRRSGADEVALIRLGRVARRLLRQAREPVVVVPPELDLERATGPVILATDATTHAGAATIEFARKVARAWGRSLVACHVAEHVDAYSALSYLNPENLQAAKQSLWDEGERVSKAWKERLDPPPDEVVLRQGKRSEELIDLARQRDACLVVLGAHELSRVERLVSSSLGTMVAARASCPVAIVPPRAG